MSTVMSSIPLLSRNTQGFNVPAGQTTVIAGLFARIHEQTSAAPSFRECVRMMLSSQLLADFGESNPDIIFINSRDANGVLNGSMTLTEALLRLMAYGDGFLQAPDIGVYVRRDSVHATHKEFRMPWDRLLMMLRTLSINVWPAFSRSLNEFWSQDVSVSAAIGSEATNYPRQSIVSNAMKAIAEKEVDFAVENKLISDADAQACLAVVGQTNQAGHAQVVLKVETRQDIYPMLGFYTFMLSPHQNDSAVLMFDLADGWKKYASVEALQASIMTRLANKDEHHLLSLALHQSNAAMLESLNGDLSGVTVALEALTQPFEQHFSETLRQKQMEDLQFEWLHIREAEGNPAAIQWDVQDSVGLADLKQIFQARLLKLYTTARASLNPDWLLFADSSRKAQYFQSEEALRVAEDYVSELIGSVGSIEGYAKAILKGYINQKLWYSVDPSLVQVELKETLLLEGEPTTLTYSKSLLEFAVEGLPYLSDNVTSNILCPVGYEHRSFNVEFVKAMLNEISIAARYGRALQSRYNEPVVRNAMAEVHAKTIALSTLVANMKGLLTDASYDLISTTLSTSRLPEGMSVSALYLKDVNRRFEDALVIEIKDADKPFILYAPGVPGREDIQSFASWRQLSFEVGGWLSHTEGVDYVYDQTVEKADSDVAVYLNGIALKPTQWHEMSVVPAKLLADGMREVFEKNAYQKLVRMLARNELVAAGIRIEKQPREVRNLLTYDARINALEMSFRRISKLDHYPVAAREECSKVLNRHLRRIGHLVEVDPDTVFFDLRNKEINPFPDFGPYTTLRSLTDLFVDGYTLEDNAFHLDAVMYSSIGQDLSALSIANVEKMIRESDFAREYVERVRGRFSAEVTLNKKRKIIFAARLRYQMLRDAFTDYMNGSLTSKQFDWLARMIGDPDQNKGWTAPPVEGRIRPLELNGLGIHGNYLLYNQDDNDPALFLAYTPDAPDGQQFRPADSVLATLHKPEMANYFYSRAPYNRQVVFGEWVNAVQDLFPSGPKLSPITRGLKTNRSDHDWGREYDRYLTYLINEADHRTESSTERRVLSNYLRFRKWGGRLVMVLPKPVQVMWHLIHGTVDIGRGLHAYQSGDRARAYGFFISAAKEGFKAAKKGHQIKKQQRKDLAKKAQQNTPRQPELAAPV